MAQYAVQHNTSSLTEYQHQTKSGKFLSGSALQRIILAPDLPVEMFTFVNAIYVKKKLVFQVKEEG